METQMALPLGINREKSIHTDLDYYEGNYACMDNDVWRNAYYRSAIKEVSSKLQLHNWFEIGPGASGTLSKMVLEADSRNELLAIEAVESSAKLVTKKLKEFSSRFRVLWGLAGKMCEPEDAVPAEALVSEILGHFGSSEGYVSILNSLGKYKFLKHVKTAIPLWFGTRMVPVDLTGMKNARLGCIGPKAVHFWKLRFADIELVPSGLHGTMEMYNSMEELKRSSQSKLGQARRFTCEWGIECESPRPFHGFGFYLVYSDDDKGPWQTSDASTRHASTSWSNPFVPIQGGEFLVQNGDRVRCRVSCFVEQDEPSYEYHVTVTRQTEKVLDETIRIGYNDLIPVLYTLRQAKKALK
eukprot:CAMPEP_0175102724 /NCGR_PEP_ID=MMETSP0086_2-20121207/8629_1 /TAXON_ID=136419 /ORGANISM="Unknown Unknown, Strain D1" /LENGTH=354 /DNA_ID=CAMNT_0016377633 /DNA_START=249 /DNA_END=1313 /DNA_ORIENTATION=-